MVMASLTSIPHPFRRRANFSSIPARPARLDPRAPAVYDRRPRADTPYPRSPMDELTAPFPSPDITNARRVPSWLVLSLLLTAGLGLRLWVIARTEVAARDSIGFIRYALRLEHDPLTKVLKEG